MSRDEMKKELLAAGWERYLPYSGLWMFCDPVCRDRICFIDSAYRSLTLRKNAAKCEASNDD